MNLQERAREVALYQAGDAELLTKMADRIEALESALREIVEWGPWVPGGAVVKPRDIAREALGEATNDA